MTLQISPPKLVLLAVHLASRADVDSLSFLVSRHREVLRTELVLRILLTYLTERTPSHAYVPFLQELATGDFPDYDPVDIDLSVVRDLGDDEAAKKVRGLRLLPLKWPDAPVYTGGHPFAVFLLLRAHRVDQECGLTQLPDLLVPFLHTVPAIRPWMVSVLLPLLRRNYEYYSKYSSPHTLTEFRNLPDPAAVSFLLSRTGVEGEEPQTVGRDLRDMLGPWLLGDPSLDKAEAEAEAETGAEVGVEEGRESGCPRFEYFLEWLALQAQKNWKLAVQVFEQWDGPIDVDLGEYGDPWWTDEQRRHLQHRYARAGLASAYLIADSTAEALNGAYKISYRVASLLGHEGEGVGVTEGLQAIASALAPVPEHGWGSVSPTKVATHMRNGLLEHSNPVTKPNNVSILLLNALVVSAFILTRTGLPCSVRRAGDIAFVHNQREQKAEVVKFIHAVATRAPKNDDGYWITARKELLWLQFWGAESSTDARRGVFGLVERQYLETEFLKALLSHMRYSLARSIYDEPSDRPLQDAVLQDTVVDAAMTAFDNSSNPNRTRGGLKKCDDIIHSLPKRVGKSLPAVRRTDALLKATHALSEYRLVLKQGEPFSPVVLRVHSDPISIITRVLEQNPKSYTKIQEFLEVGANMVLAGLYTRKRPSRTATSADEEPRNLFMSEKRVTAMCIEAALGEDDFETAYSYVVNRLSAPQDMPASMSSAGGEKMVDIWSWSAALLAGQYMRTAKTLRPTHLGTASGNLDIRHLEQRIECLATALRITPAAQLHEILKTFRRCEEQLDSAIKEESAREEAWNAAGDLHSPGIPGAFAPRSAHHAHPAHHPTLSGQGVQGAQGPHSGASVAAKQNDDGPVSLFDLGRATAEVAKRNLGVLSSSRPSEPQPQHGSGSETEEPRTNKRDKLRDAAVGTLVSGVGWLVGAPAPSRE